jgi:hypothetical protein
LTFFDRKEQNRQFMMRIRIHVALLFISLAASAQAAADPPPTIHRSAAFPAQTTIAPAADVASSVFAADVDGDGDLDVLSASAADDKIAWYENTDGVGSFGNQQVISTAADSVISVFAADLDGDGDVDVLSASNNDDKIAWYENTDGAGSFGSQQVITAAAGFAASVFAADVDGDGDLDVLSASFADDKIAWYENTDGAASFGTQQVISTAADGVWSIFAADVDGDGDVDVLSASYYDDEIAWYENTDGAGSFGSQQVISTAADGAWSVFAADVDGDGDADVLSASVNDDEIAWYENTDGAGSFGSQQVISTAADWTQSVFAADVDGDGDVDVLSASYYDDKIAWYENTDGAGSFGSQQVITTAADGAVWVFAADVDGDGDVDVLSASVNDDKIAWYENTDGAGSFGSQQAITTAAYAPTSVFAADLDGDGDLDVLSASAADDKIAWYENTDGVGSFGNQQVISTAVDGAISVFAADVDGDGDVDVLSASYWDDKIAWYENTDGAGSFGSQQVISTAADFAWSVFAADVDGDTDLDVLSASKFDDEIAWYENTDGAGSFGGQQVISTAADGAVWVFAADVDGDEDMDVLSASGNDDEIAWYENTDGAGSFGGQQVITTAAVGASSVFAADVDGDGDLDVLSASYLDDKIAWHENTDGAGSFGSQQVITTAAGGAWSVFAADVDEDGDVDVLSASYYDDEIAWYENTDGAGSFGSQQVITTAADGARSVFAADVDGDGDLDVLSASSDDDRIAWYENRGGQFALATADTAPMLLLQGDTSDLLEIVMTHRGRAGDSDEELATLELLFEETAGDPLTTTEANALIETLAVYRDDGSGVFEAGSDTLVGSVGTLSLNAGTQTVTLPDGHAGAQVVFGTPGTFFVVVTLMSDANSWTPHRFRVTHVTESSSTAEDRATDIPLLLEYAANVSSRSVLAASPTSDEDDDGLFDVVETDTGVYLSPTDTGTDPFDSDTDADGLLDGVEDDTGVYVSPTQTGTDPFDSDTDDDGLLDGVEDNSGVYVSPTQTGTDPNDSDTDDDGLLDGVEDNSGVYVSPTQAGTDPNDSDSDDDGYSDGREVARGSDPNDPYQIPLVPALGIWGRALLLLLLAGAGARGLTLRRRRG